MESAIKNVIFRSVTEIWGTVIQVSSALKAAFCTKLITESAIKTV